MKCRILRYKTDRLKSIKHKLRTDKQKSRPRPGGYQSEVVCCVSILA